MGELFLTARLPAEALIVTALALHLHGAKRLGFAVAATAMSIHPLIALPGVLLLASLHTGGRIAAWGAAASVAAILALAAAAASFSAVSRWLPLMDPAWLNLVQERSQFLFLPLWTYRDWELNARPFVYLAFAVTAVADARIKALCVSAALVGASGLLVAFVASVVGPVAILVQGQAWRWVWITALLGVILLPVILLSISKDAKCGPPCALLLVSGWALPPVVGTACASFALALWVMRANIGVRVAVLVRWASLAIGAAIIVWVSAKAWNIIIGSTQHTLDAIQVAEIFKVKTTAAALAMLAWLSIRLCRRAWIPLTISAMFVALSILFLPAAFMQSRSYGSAAEVAEFADWRASIPPNSTVLVAPPTDVGAFVWFTLERPNYLSLDQSAGAVFSRTTAMEIRRRSEVLMPITDPDWMIMSNLRDRAAAGHDLKTVTRPLSAETLTLICMDPKLGFVISQQKVGFDPARHFHAGPWLNWNLYNCDSVRFPAAAI